MKIDDIVKVENLKRQNKEAYAIRWNITRVCNYQCDFCIQGDLEKHKKDSQGESKKIRMAVCDKLKELIENELTEFKRLDFYLIGGEVTILKDLPEILEKLVDVKYKGMINFYITTNFSCSIEYLEKIKNIFKDKKKRSLHMIASYYKKYTTEQEFMEKVKFMYAHNKRDSYISRIRCKKLKKGLKKIFGTKTNIYMSIGYPLIEDSDYKEYLKFVFRNLRHCNSIDYIVIRKYKRMISSHLMNKLKKNNRRNVRVTLKDGTVKYFTRTANISLAIEDTHCFNTTGFLCDVGIFGITVNNKGVVSRCLSCVKKSVVGNILDDDFKLITDKYICQSPRCSCDYYSLIERK